MLRRGCIVDKKDAVLFSQLFFRTDELPDNFDYFEFLSQYCRLLILYSGVEDSSFYQDVKFLDVVIRGFQYCHGFYFPDTVFPQEIESYISLGRKISSQMNEIQNDRMKSKEKELTEDEKAVVLSLRCATNLLFSDPTASQVALGLVHNISLITSVVDSINDTVKRRM